MQPTRAPWQPQTTLYAVMDCHRLRLGGSGDSSAKNLLVQTHFLSGFTKKYVAVLKTPVDHEFEMQS